MSHNKLSPGNIANELLENGPSRIGEVGKFAVGTAVGAAQKILDITRTVFDLEEPTYKELGYQVNHEGLTHTLSRKGLFTAMEEFSRSNDCQDFVAVFVDLKGFKAFNDDFGHLMGDNALRAAGWGMKQLFRLPEDWKHPRDTKSLVARLGGDEFIGLLPRGDDLGEMLGNSIVYNTISEVGREELSGQFSNVAEWNVQQFLQSVDESKVPLDALTALHVIGATGIPIVFRYDIGRVSLVDGCAEDAVVDFLEGHGSKYVRVSDLIKK